MNNKEIADAFRAAKRFLWDGVTLDNHSLTGSSNVAFICHAIRKAYDKRLIRNEARQAAVDTVMGRIGRCPTVTVWLRVKAGVQATTAEQRQQYRHRWIDSLIEEFSND